MHSYATSLLVTKKAVNKDNRVYNSPMSRLALGYVWLYQILKAKFLCQQITYEEGKVLKQLEKTSIETTVVPGPYVTFLQAVGYHLPSDKRYDVIYPTIPTVDKLTGSGKQTDIYPTVFPHFPTLINLCKVIAEGHVGDKAKYDHTVGTTTTERSEQIYLYKGHLVPWTTSAKTWKDPFNRITYPHDLKAPAERADFTHLRYSPFFLYKFWDDEEKLEDVTRVYPGSEIPRIEMRNTHYDYDSDLLRFFGVKGNVRWLNSILEMLDYESKFFNGSVPVRQIGHETGANALTMVKMVVDDTSPALTDDWFGSFKIPDESISVETRMEGVSDFDLQMNLLTCTIMEFEVPAGTNDFRKVEPVEKITGRSANTGGISPFSETLKKSIVRQSPLSNRFRSHVESEMIKPIREVVG
jgi:hypothetical protein